MMGWRKELILKVIAELEKNTNILTVGMITKEIIESIEKGLIPRCPFALLHWVGYTQEDKGDNYLRTISIPILLGVNALRGDEETFIGRDAPVGMFTMEQFLSEIEDHFDGLEIYEYPVIVRPEEYEADINGVKIYSIELEIKGNFQKKY